MVRRGFVVCAVGILLALSSRTATADPVTITFDELWPGFYGTFQYSSVGVVFLSGSHDDFGGSSVTGGFNVAASPGAVSPPNVMRPRDPTFDVFTDVAAVFFVPFTTLPSNSPFGRTDFVSVAVVGANPAAAWEFRLVSLSGYLNSVTGTTDQLLIFQRPTADIVGFELRGTGTEALDNVSFNTPAPVPEPGTLTLCAVGAGAGAARRWVRRRRVKGAPAQSASGVGR